MYINSTVATIEVPRLFELQTHTGFLRMQDKPPFSKMSNESLFRGEQRRELAIHHWDHYTLWLEVFHTTFHFYLLQVVCPFPQNIFFFESQSQWHVALIARFANNLQTPNQNLLSPWNWVTKWTTWGFLDLPRPAPSLSCFNYPKWEKLLIGDVFKQSVYHGK